jgi:hypothetical protein
MQDTIMRCACFAYPSSRPQAIGSLEKELSAKPTEDGLAQYDNLSSHSDASTSKFSMSS